MRFHVVITDFLEDALVETPVLADIADVHLARANSEAELVPRLDDADVLICYHEIERFGDATFAAAPRCRGLVRAGVGFNNVDIDAADRRGVVVCNVPDYGTEEVADHAILLLLALSRRLVPCDHAIRNGQWDFNAALGVPRLRGMRLGIVGCGRIGTATALRAKAFGLNIAFFDPYSPPGLDKALGIERATSLDALLEQSDFLSLHCYLSAETHHLIDARALARLPKGAFLINTARGPVVDQNALIESLQSGHLGGAGLDVFEREPLDDGRLRCFPNVIFTPHSAFYSVEGFVELRRKAAEEARRLLLGERPWNPVNRRGA